MCRGIWMAWVWWAARQQRAINPAKPWNVLDPGLHSSFILSRISAAALKRCTACQGVDHTTSECALASIEPAVQQTGHRRSYICASWNRGASSFPGTCSYVCSICFGTHKARECSSARGTQAPPQSRRSLQTPPKQWLVDSHCATGYLLHLPHSFILSIHLFHWLYVIGHLYFYFILFFHYLRCHCCLLLSFQFRAGVFSSSRGSGGRYLYTSDLLKLGAFCRMSTPAGQGLPPLLARVIWHHCNVITLTGVSYHGCWGA